MYLLGTLLQQDIILSLYYINQTTMSQFYGYTVDITLKDKDETIRGIIEKIGDKEITLRNPVNVKKDGSYAKVDSSQLNISSSTIADLDVIELAKNDNKYIKKQMKLLKNKDQSQSRSQSNSEPLQQSESSQSKEKEKRGKSNKKKNTNNRLTSTSTSTSFGDSDSCLSPKNDLDVRYVDVYNEKPSQKKKKSDLMDEFDFAANLQKFDKKSVFEDISNNDHIDESNRLVSINRNDNKKEKYGIDEMVLKKNKHDGWDNNDNFDYSNVINGSNKAKKNTSSDTSQGNDSNISLQSRAVSTASYERKPSLTPSFAQFFSSIYDESPVPTCSTLQISDVFTLCKTKFELTDQILNENAGNNLSDLVVNKIIGGFRIALKNHNEAPLVLLLVGNNKAGSVALTTARHLFNKGMKTMVYLLYNTKISQDELFDEVDDELKRYSKIGGKMTNSIEQLEQYLNNPDGSPLEFIIDGLQGFDTDINDYGEQESAEANKLIHWCNSSKVPVLSLDIPSGLNPSSGTNDSNESLVVNSRFVASIGLPLSSNLNMYKFGYCEKGRVTHYLVDAGIPRRVYTMKGGLRKFDRRWFAESGSVELKVV